MGHTAILETCSAIEHVTNISKAGFLTLKCLDLQSQGQWPMYSTTGFKKNHPQALHLAG